MPPFTCHHLGQPPDPQGVWGQVASESPTDPAVHTHPLPGAAGRALPRAPGLACVCKRRVLTKRGSLRSDPPGLPRICCPPTINSVLFSPERPGLADISHSYPIYNPVVGYAINSEGDNQHLKEGSTENVALWSVCVGSQCENAFLTVDFNQELKAPWLDQRLDSGNF